MLFRNNVVPESGAARGEKGNGSAPLGVASKSGLLAPLPSNVADASATLG